MLQIFVAHHPFTENLIRITQFYLVHVWEKNGCKYIFSTLFDHSILYSSYRLFLCILLSALDIYILHSSAILSHASSSSLWLTILTVSFWSIHHCIIKILPVCTKRPVPLQLSFTFSPPLFIFCHSIYHYLAYCNFCWVVVYFQSSESLFFI